MNTFITVARECKKLPGKDKDEPIPNILGSVDHGARMSDKKTKKCLRVEEEEFNHNIRELASHKKSAIFMLMGRDGAGKSGLTKVIVKALGGDFKILGTVTCGPPNQVELDHSWLWKYIADKNWPAIGQVRVFDRGWAERVLVEKVMKFTEPEAIQKSYGEMRMFERLLIEQGIVLVKLWLDITFDEQGRRFKAREGRRPWKVSKNDGIARAHWDDYTPAANELFHRTGTTFAPWHIISSEDKNFCRVTAMQIINARLRAALAD